MLDSNNLNIIQWEGAKNAANWPSRISDYKEGYEELTTWLFAVKEASTIQLYNNLLQAIVTIIVSDVPAAEWEMWDCHYGKYSSYHSVESWWAR
jgi:hypothetical protein